MPFYRVPALGGNGDPEGIRPDLSGISAPNWTGVYDEVAHEYVIKTPDDAPLALPALDPEAPSSIDYSDLIVPEELQRPLEPSSEPYDVPDAPA